MLYYNPIERNTCFMTLKEIAALSGVSVSTVSRIINSPDDSFARREVRERVWQIIKTTGYTPNINARQLKCGKKTTSQSGAIVTILGRTKLLDENPFFAHLSRSIEQHAMNNGYPVRFSYSAFDIDKDNIIEKSQSLNIEGAIVIGRLNSKIINFLEKQYINIVYTGRNEISAGWDQIICDGYEATHIAMNYLVSCGHRKIAYIGEIADEVRYKAYIDFIRNNNLPFEPSYICSCPQNSAGGRHGADILARSSAGLPTAVFCSADISAIAAIKHFKELGIKVPEQISVISLDNIEMAGYVSPMLTTVGMPIVEMGQIAVQTLIDRIQKRHKLPMKIFLPNKLTIRESVYEYSK